MQKIIAPALALLTVALGVALLFSGLNQSNLQEENRSLRQQLENLTANQNEPPAPVTTAPAPESPAATADAELVRLRGEVSNLRREKQELEKLRAENQTLRAQSQANAAAQPQLTDIPVPKTYRRENWAFTGYADPESALQSVLWAGAAGNPAAILAGFTQEQIARMQTEDNRNQTEAEVAERIAKQIAAIKSFHVLKNEPVSDNEAVLTLFIDGMEGSEQTPRMKMQRVGNEWRLAGPYHGAEAKPGN